MACGVAAGRDASVARCDVQRACPCSLRARDRSDTVAPMRQPTFDRKRRARQQRLLRTGIGVVVAVAVAAVVANLFSGSSDTPPKASEVAFSAEGAAYTDAGNLRRAKSIPLRRENAERMALTQILNLLYQRTFVDPSAFQAEGEVDGELAFPPPDVLELFGDEARAAVLTDLDAATLGTERTQFVQVEPTTALAKIAIFFRDANAPALATAAVQFGATGTLRDEGAFQVAITQRATFHFAHEQGRWVIVFYEASQTQDSIVPAPEGSPS